MTDREKRGRAIAEAGCLTRKGMSNEWHVPSQSGKGKYVVILNAEQVALHLSRFRASGDEVQAHLCG